MKFSKDQLFAMNRPFLEEMFVQFLQDPNIGQDWQEFFADFIDPQVIEKIIALQGRKNFTTQELNSLSKDSLILKVLMMIRGMRKNGYRSENINPLQLNPQQYFSLDNFEFSEEEKDQVIDFGGYWDVHRISVKALFIKAQQIYCNGRLHFDFNHIYNSQIIHWFDEKVVHPIPNYSIEQKKEFWQHLAKAEFFEQFVHKKYIGAKRFSIEGGETFILGLQHLINLAAQEKISEISIGMAHRGRLTTLTQIVGKPYSALFNEFNGQPFCPSEFKIDTDVKYHMGFSSDQKIDGHSIHISMLPNPSHLEAVNTVLLGSVKAKQVQQKTQNIIPVLVHGDASFTGQGIVQEMLCIKEIEGFDTAGTIHIIINNQVGFTADTWEVRNDDLFPTNVARSNEMPILHINGDDPEAVAYAMEIAFEFRQKFHKSVLLNLICYRRYGHNEGDEPRFTQPEMYAIIDKMPTIVQKYREQLVFKENCDPKFFDDFKIQFTEKLQQELNLAKENFQYGNFLFQGLWKKFRKNNFVWDVKTGVAKKTLQDLAKKIFDFSGYTINEKLQKILDNRRENILQDKDLDWGAAENLAIASLISEKTPVRICGQDVGRGTFAHRHAKLTDKENGEKHTIFHQINPGLCAILNSPLSEYGVLGFEYGYSTPNPDQLVIWEAQFGDFGNGAQIIIDQFIASSEHKWLRLSNLVVSLPHGYEGQGPEHSSGRIERFLQLCSSENMIIINCSTPANYFHALRRQVQAPFRKPLIAFTPKSLLRHKMSTSTLNDLGGDFQPIICRENSKPKKIILCSGKVYYDLLNEMQKRDCDDFYIIRIEQFYPFPLQQIQDILQKIDSKEKLPIIWLQEEPKNMGAWSFIQEIFLENLSTRKINYVGRDRAAVSAVGTGSQHQAQYQKFMEEVFG